MAQNLHVGGCQKHGPLLGPLKYKVLNYTKDPKRDHDLDNYPCGSSVVVSLVGAQGGSDPKIFRIFS